MSENPAAEPVSDADATPLPDARRALLDALSTELLALHPRGRIIVAIDGVDGAGKTRFADDWAPVLRARGAAVVRASIDGFHQPRSARYARGRESAEGYYRDSFDLGALRARLVEPFRSGAEEVGTAVFDHASDSAVDERESGIPRDAVLLLDGIFLHRPELRTLWHWTIWLDVPPEVRDARLRARDGAHSVAPRYTEGQYLYEKEANPRRAASVIIDNADPASPRRLFDDFC
ncbi:uridine kinase [Microcella daejeonensis]|uniref:uridine kinase n=1 Tax=Microcella daejeonensis TaxID=2994971 RepID=UPI002271133B|nr:uridine kinase [Microcella daejeonensis]WAB83174.1 uridine kinase [Microcella daejeonensis]